MNEEIEPGFMTFYETNIPGSGFRVQGDGTDRETFIRLPDTGEKYTVEIRGTGVGTFTYEVERDRGSMIHANTILGYAEYAGIPVTPLTVATTTLEFEPVGLDATTTSGFIEMTKPISVDIDGDGSPDFQATSTATHVIGDVVISGKRCQWLKRIMPPAISGQQKGKDLVKRLEKYMELCSKRGLRIRSDEHEELGNSETADGPSPEYLKIIDTPHDHMKRSDLSGDKQNRFLDDMDKFISRLE